MSGGYHVNLHCRLSTRVIANAPPPHFIMAQPRLIAIVGCTGTQGSSVARAFASDPNWKVRGLTRKLTSESAMNARRSLPAAVEWIQADVNDPASLVAAFSGAYAVYGMTSGFDDELVERREQERQQGINIAQSAEEAGVQYLIWSSLPDTRITSHGRFTSLKHTYLKAEVTAHIRHQLSRNNHNTNQHQSRIKPIFLLLGTFMSNYTTKFPPKRNADNVVVFSLPASPSVQLDLFNIRQLGQISHSILTQPERYIDREVVLVAERLTGAQLAEAYQRVSGEAAVYEVMGDEEFVELGGGDSRAEELCDMFHYYDQFGLYGEQEASDSGGAEVLYDISKARIEFKLDSFEHFLRSTGFRALNRDAVGTKER